MRDLKRKKYLYIGIVLLVTGIALRSLGIWGMFPYFLIGLGAANKLAYIILSMKHRKYKPGYELFVLYSGLAIFFTGLYLKNNSLWEYASVLMAVGIAFKMGFLLLFMRKFRVRVQKQPIKNTLKK